MSLVRILLLPWIHQVTLGKSLSLHLHPSLQYGDNIYLSYRVVRRLTIYVNSLEHWLTLEMLRISILTCKAGRSYIMIGVGKRLSLSGRVFASHAQGPRFSLQWKWCERSYCSLTRPRRASAHLIRHLWSTVGGWWSWFDINEAAEKWG